MFKKIVFMGTPDFSVPILKSLYQNGYPVVTIYTQPPQESQRGQRINKSPIQKMAENLCIDFRTPAKLKDNIEEYNFIKSLNPDLVIVVAYGQILPQRILDTARFSFLNGHASDLPRWRGAAPLERCLIEGDKQTAMSVMDMTAGLDEGDVLHKEVFKIQPDWTIRELSECMQESCSKLLLEVLYKKGRFDDTNAMFIKPEKFNCHVTTQNAKKWAIKIAEEIK